MLPRHSRFTDRAGFATLKPYRRGNMPRPAGEYAERMAGYVPATHVLPIDGFCTKLKPYEEEKLITSYKNLTRQRLDKPTSPQAGGRMNANNASKITETTIYQRTNLSLQTLVASALVLPGLVQHSAQAAEDDEVDFQYSHYQESKRDILGTSATFDAQKVPQNLNPIEVDSIHGSARVTLTDRVKFAFNYLQDTWSGATPIGTAPAVSNGNHALGIYDSNNKLVTRTGASPLASYSGGFGYMFVDKNKHFYQAVFDPNLFDYLPGKRDDRLTHVLSYASPETRKQGDFKLSYQWDEAELTVGGGISVENDYESRFGNIGGRIDFNQKQTSLNWGVSYTNSDTNASLDPDGLPFFNTDSYAINDCDSVTGSVPLTGKTVSTAYLEKTCTLNGETYQLSGGNLHGNRQDWGAQLGLSQILSKNALVSLDLAYTRSTGYLSNPYKVVYAYLVAADSNIKTFGAKQRPFTGSISRNPPG